MIKDEVPLETDNKTIVNQLKKHGKIKIKIINIISQGAVENALEEYGIDYTTDTQREHIIYKLN